MDGYQITDKEFRRFQELIFGIAGIHLAESKKPLLCGRLSKRLRSRALASYGDYFELITSGREAAELQTCVNLLTTNETYFFREGRHFDFLREQILPRYQRCPPRVWSAACSSGEEPYSIAMVMAEFFGLERQWEVFGSDLSTAVLQTAREAVYPLERARDLPQGCLHRYCLKGVGAQAGWLRIDGRLRQRVRFGQVNLNAPLSGVGQFDVIFLRNVLIYFPPEVKRRIVARLVGQLHPQGWFLVGHSESLNGVSDALQPVAPTIYRREAR